MVACHPDPHRRRRQTGSRLTLGWKAGAADLVGAEDAGAGVRGEGGGREGAVLAVVDGGAEGLADEVLVGP